MRFQEVRLGLVSSIPITNGLGEAAAEGDLDWPRYIRTTDISGLFALDPDKRVTLPPDVARRARLEPGDLLMTAAGSLGTSFMFQGEEPSCYAGYLVRFRADRGRCAPKFAAYWTQSQHHLAQIAVGAVRSTIDNYSAGKFRSTLIPLPDLDEQRRIADFLDDQVARIDQAMNEYQDELTLLQEARSVALDSALQARGLVFPSDLDGTWAHLPHEWRIARLGVVVAEFTNGYVGPTRDILVDEGIRYIQSVHIKKQRIEFDIRPFFVTERWHRDRPRISLRPGDVLIVQTGDIGQVAVVPDDFGPASCHALQIARVKKNLLSGSYLGAYLSSSFARAAMLSRATGALHPHLEAGVKGIPVVLPPLDEQDAILAVHAEKVDGLDTCASHVERARSLLEERKRSLITAAVTGELDVSSASSRAADAVVGG